MSDQSIDLAAIRARLETARVAASSQSVRDKVAMVAIANVAGDVPALLAEVDRLREGERSFAEALGYGDGRTEPAASLTEMVDPLSDALAAAREHDECPVVCELCGERLASTRCPECHGSGCLPNAELAYLECGTCAGVGRTHEGCVERSYQNLAAERDALAAKLARVEALTYASDDGSGWGHEHPVVGGLIATGSPECPACWVEDIRTALGGE